MAKPKKKNQTHQPIPAAQVGPSLAAAHSPPSPEPSPVHLLPSLPFTGRPSSPPCGPRPCAARQPHPPDAPAHLLVPPPLSARAPSLTAWSHTPATPPAPRHALSLPRLAHPSAAPSPPFLPPRRETEPRDHRRGRRDPYPAAPRRDLRPASLNAQAGPPPAPYLAHSSTPESPAPPHPSARLAAAGKHRHCNFLAAGNHKASLTPRHRCRTAANLPRWISSTGSSFLDPGHELRHAIAVVPRRRAAASRLRPPRPPVSTARTP